MLQTFSKKILKTDQPTNRPTTVGIDASSRSIKTVELYAINRNGPVWRYTENGWENVANISYDWSVSDISLDFTLCSVKYSLYQTQTSIILKL